MNLTAMLIHCSISHRKTLEVLGLVLMNKRKVSWNNNLNSGVKGERERLDDSNRRETNEATEAACVCMKTSFRKKLHLGWVQCDVCDRHCHITCAGAPALIKFVMHCM